MKCLFCQSNHGHLEIELKEPIVMTENTRIEGHNTEQMLAIAEKHGLARWFCWKCGSYSQVKP